MKKKRKRTNYVQTVYSEPRKIRKGTYKTKSGQKKVRYVKNSNAVPIRQVTHNAPHGKI